VSTETPALGHNPFTAAVAGAEADPGAARKAPGHTVPGSAPPPALTFGSERERRAADADDGAPAAGLASARGGVTGQGFASVREAPEARKEHEES